MFLNFFCGKFSFLHFKVRLDSSTYLPKLNIILKLKMYICIHKVSKQRKILINICEDFQDKLELQSFFPQAEIKVLSR